MRSLELAEACVAEWRTAGVLDPAGGASRALAEGSVGCRAVGERALAEPCPLELPSALLLGPPFMDCPATGVRALVGAPVVELLAAPACDPADGWAEAADGCMGSLQTRHARVPTLIVTQPESGPSPERSS